LRRQRLGTPFDVNEGEPRRVTGVRNIRQALASPYPGLFHDPSRLGVFMNRPSPVVLFLVVAALTSACALSLRTPHIADLRDNPGRYQNHSVSIDGVVTSSWGLPLVPFRVYKVEDGTGEVTILSQGNRTPTRGAHVRVKGKVNEFGVFGGQALGLHLREESLYVKR
jgi:hypothetical protein